MSCGTRQDRNRRRYPAAWFKHGVPVAKAAVVEQQMLKSARREPAHGCSRLMQGGWYIVATIPNRFEKGMVAQQIGIPGFCNDGIQ